MPPSTASNLAQRLPIKHQTQQPDSHELQALLPSISHCFIFKRSNGSLVGEVELEQVSETLEADPDCFVWISLLKPGPALLAQVKEEFNLHELAIEDAAVQHQRTKIETYGDTLFVVLKTVKREEMLEFGSTYIFLSKRFIISIRQNGNLEEKDVVRFCLSNTQKLMQGPGYIFYAIMDYIVDQYAPIIEQFDERLQHLERYIFSEQFNKRTLKYLYFLKEELTHFRLAVAPMQEITRFFLAHQQTETSDYISRHSQPYFRDIQDHVLATLDVSNSQSEMIKVAMDTYLALVSLSQSEIVKKLASWAAILAVPTLITSVYGMNFQYMPELHWRYAYFVVVGLLVAVSLFLYYQFKRVNWL